MVNYMWRNWAVMVVKHCLLLALMLQTLNSARSMQDKQSFHRQQKHSFVKYTPAHSRQTFGADVLLA